MNALPVAYRHFAATRHIDHRKNINRELSRFCKIRCSRRGAGRCWGCCCTCSGLLSMNFPLRRAGRPRNANWCRSWVLFSRALIRHRIVKFACSEYLRVHKGPESDFSFTSRRRFVRMDQASCFAVKSSIRRKRPLRPTLPPHRFLDLDQCSLILFMQARLSRSLIVKTF